MAHTVHTERPSAAESSTSGALRESPLFYTKDRHPSAGLGTMLPKPCPSSPAG